MEINKNSYFAKGIAHLLVYQTVNGNLDVDENYSTSDRFPLGGFVHELRDAAKQGNLGADQKEKLRSIGFAMDGSEQPWETMYHLVKEYIQIHDGKFPMVTEKTSEDILIGAWVRQQKMTIRHLPLEKRKLLREIGILDT